MSDPANGPAPVYRGFRPRPERIPITAGRVDPAKSFDYLRRLVGGAPPPPVEANAETPYVGITTDGTVRPGLFPLADEDLDQRPILEAANAFLDALSPTQRARSGARIDGAEWRRWTNAFPSYEPHGVLLEELDDDAREGAMSLVGASLSTTGAHDAAEAMALNGELGARIGQYRDSLTPWMYWLTLFGAPSPSEPWGWQLAGHHVDLHCFLLGRQMVGTPMFLGTELEADRIFADQRRRALELVHGLSPRARRAAVLYASMEPGVLPAALAGPVDGRHLGGAGQDNRVIPYEGVRADTLTSGERAALLALCDTFLRRLPDGPARHRRRAVESHLGETYLAWIGGTGEEDPFYFRLHSPVLLAEYDNHPGVFLDADRPQPFHVHSVLRTPNGNDYGKDLLRAHHVTHHRPAAGRAPVPGP